MPTLTDWQLMGVLATIMGVWTALVVELRPAIKRWRAARKASRLKG